MEKNENENAQYSLLKNDYFIKHLSKKFIISSIISTLSVFAGSLIDTLIVGFFLGEEGLSAMSLVSPVYLIFYTVGATIGIGSSILASRVLGKSDVDEYRRIFTSATISLLLAAVVMVLASYVFFNPIADLLCGNVTDARKDMFRQYLLYYIPGGAFTLMTYVPLYFLKTDGKPKLSSRLFTLSAVMNVILSWLFMSPIVDMGIGGASLATSISMGTVTVLGFILILRGNTELRFVKKSLSWKRWKDSAVAGIPNGMNNLLNSARILLINMLLMFTGAGAFLSCYTVVRNVTDILNSVILGVSSAIIPLAGVLFGERDYAGNRMVMRHAMKLGLRIMIPLVVVVSALPDIIFPIFAVKDAALLAEGRWALPLSCIGLIIGYINTLYTGYLTATKHEALATVIVILRMFAALAAFAFPLSVLFGSKGIWASLSLAEIAAFAIYQLIAFIMRKRNPSLDKYLLNTEKEHEGDISFSVPNAVDGIVFASEQISGFCEDNGIDMRRSMRVSLAIEEILTFLNAHCLSQDENGYTDVRVCKLENEVMVRFRYVGEIYDPTAYYKNNEASEELQEELVGLKLIMKSASLVNFSQTLGANNLMIVF